MAGGRWREGGKGNERRIVERARYSRVPGILGPRVDHEARARDRRN